VSPEKLKGEGLPLPGKTARTALNAPAATRPLS
jgi:cytochrome o ubiquinol oxidase subunit II